MRIGCGDGSLALGCIGQWSVGGQFWPAGFWYWWKRPRIGVWSRNRDSGCRRTRRWVLGVDEAPMMADGTRRQVLLNQVAQAVRGICDVFVELDSIDEVSRLAWFDDLAMAVSQSHPQSTEIDAAIVASGLKSTFTPCVVLKTRALGEALSTIRT